MEFRKVFENSEIKVGQWDDSNKKLRIYRKDKNKFFLVDDSDGTSDELNGLITWVKTQKEAEKAQKLVKYPKKFYDYMKKVDKKIFDYMSISEIDEWIASLQGER